MKDKDHNQIQLLNEVVELRKRIAELEAFESERERMKEELAQFKLNLEERTLYLTKEVDKHKQEEQKLKIFSDAIENAYDGIVLTDLQGNLTYANVSALVICGYTLDELTKLNVAQWVPDPQISREIIEEEIKTGTWKGEFTGMRKNRETFPCMLSASLIKRSP